MSYDTTGRFEGKVVCRRMQIHNLVPNVSSLETLAKEIKYEFQGGHMAGEDQESQQQKIIHLVGELQYLHFAKRSF